MAVFFYHVRDGDMLIQDLEGQELPDLSAVIDEARLAAREVALHLLASGGVLDEDVVMEVTDETGDMVLTVPLFEALKQPLVQ